MNASPVQKTICLLILGVASSSPLSSYASDWMTWQSTYTHDPSGQPVDQYALPQQPLGPARSAVSRSGYRHYRSTLQAGQSSDNMHIVEEWGRQTVPYEHWRFPYRPYGVPYDAWGPQAPYGIFNGQFNGVFPPYGYAPPGGGYPAPRHPVSPPASGTHPGSGHPPYYDPYYAHPYYRGMPPGSGRPPGANIPGQFPGYGNNFPGASRGFPLQPEYRNQPWYDGNYPSAAPLDNRTDAQFFYHPPLGRKEQLRPAPAPTP